MSDQIEIIAIGNELLKGITVNTNAAEISLALLKNGYRCQYHTVIPDDRELIKKQLHTSLHRSKIVIATGGLGPTCDDITREVAAEVFDSPLTFNEALAEELKQRYGNLPISLTNQATVPAKALHLKNPLGTSPGFVFNTEQGILILMPGVPKEMRTMLNEQLIPYLKKNFPVPNPPLSRAVHLFNLGESSVDPLLRTLEIEYPQVEFGIYPSPGLISIYATINNTDRESEKQLITITQTLKQQFADHYYSDQSEKIEEAIQQLFIEQGWTLGTAESCTGGAISARLVKNAGASQYFLGGLVTYSNGLKEKLLNVNKSIIATEGAVSEETVKAMSLGALNTIGSDFSIAVSGITGPSGGTEKNPVGTVWIAIAKKGQQVRCHKIQGAYGNREMIIERSVNFTLGTLYRYALTQIGK